MRILNEFNDQDQSKRDREENEVKAIAPLATIKPADVKPLTPRP